MLNGFFEGTPGEVVGWTAAIGALLQYLLAKRKASSGDLRFMVESLQEENRHKGDQIQRLTLRVESLTVRLEIMQNAKYESSLPFWIKSKSGRLIYANGAYRNHFLTPNGFTYEDVVDKTDDEIWPDKAIAAIYRQNDLEVMRTGSAKRFEAVMSVAGNDVQYIAYIDPYFVRGSIAGVVGVAVPAE